MEQSSVLPKVDCKTMPLPTQRQLGFRFSSAAGIAVVGASVPLFLLRSYTKCLLSPSAVFQKACVLSFCDQVWEARNKMLSIFTGNRVHLSLVNRVHFSLVIGSRHGDVISERPRWKYFGSQHVSLGIRTHRLVMHLPKSRFL